MDLMDLGVVFSKLTEALIKTFTKTLTKILILLQSSYKEYFYKDSYKGGSNIKPKLQLKVLKPVKPPTHGRTLLHVGATAPYC